MGNCTHYYYTVAQNRLQPHFSGFRGRFMVFFHANGTFFMKHYFLQYSNFKLSTLRLMFLFYYQVAKT